MENLLTLLMLLGAVFLHEMQSILRTVHWKFFDNDEIGVIILTTLYWVFIGCAITEAY